MFERRLFIYGVEPWFEDDQGVSYAEQAESTPLRQRKGIRVGYAIWEGDDEDRPGQRQVISEDMYVTFPPSGPGPREISWDDLSDAVELQMAPSGLALTEDTKAWADKLRAKAQEQGLD